MSSKDCIISGKTNDRADKDIEIHRTFVPEGDSAYAMYKGALELILLHPEHHEFLGCGLTITDEKSAEVEVILEYDGRNYYLQSLTGERLVTEKW